MSNVETIVGASIFIDDFEPGMIRAVREYVADVKLSLYLPHQEDAWGCVSATGAFIINQVLGETVTNAAELDEAMEREPGKPGDNPKLSLEILKRGLFQEYFTPYSPLEEPAEKLVNGKIDFDEYLPVYEQVYGTVPRNQYELIRAYYKETFIPAYLAREERFGSYKQSGQLVSNKNCLISEELLTGLVNDGKYVFATTTREGSVGEHAIALFRPNLEMPALCFSPGTVIDRPPYGSTVRPLTRPKYENLRTNAIGAISLWQK